MNGVAEPEEGGAPSAVDPQHPWLGLASYTEETRSYFHGREEEVGELARRVQRKLLTILFGQSGLGKTSILRAGIVPRLRPEGYCPVYVRIDYSPEAPPPSEQIKRAIFNATQATGQWTRPGAAVEGESLWEFLHHRDDMLCDASGKAIIPLLIFDQFEEIFTLGQGNDAGRQRAAEFIEDLADLVENRLPRALEERLEVDDTIPERFDFSRADYRILIALREDYLAHLEGLKGVMPSITQNRMRLARMNGEQALAAVMKPGGRLVSEEVAASIVRFVAGGAELRNAEVEPSLLSLICRELNNARIAQGRDEISADLLAGSRDTIFNEFYERALADQPAAVRKIIEDELLTESGFRESLAEERVLKAFADAGAPPDALATLVNRRLLRIEERLDVRRVELTHDVLCSVVRASRDLRLEREARDAAERRLEAQRAREAATRKALKRARQIAAGCAVLALAALGSAIFAYQSTKRAQHAEAAALQTRQLAETARGEAEKLMVYLLDDFTRELDPIGRLDIVAGLALRALDYYRDLPDELRTPDTERNRALALVRYGAVLRSQGETAEALVPLDEADAVFNRLRAEGDSSEVLVLGMANGLRLRLAILGSQGRFPEAFAAGDAGLAVLRPLAAMPDASPAVRRDLGHLLLVYGFGLLRSGQLEQSVEAFTESQQIYGRLGAPDLGDLEVAAAYGSSGVWLAEAYGRLGELAQSRAKYEEAYRVATSVLDVMPGHATGMHTKGVAAGALGEFEASEGRLESALEFSAEHAAIYEAVLKTAPTNAAAWNNLGVAYQASSGYLRDLGRFEEARDRLRAATGVGDKMQNLGSTAMNLVWWFSDLADLESEAGDPAATAAAMTQAERVLQNEVLPSMSGFQASTLTIRLDISRARGLLARGEFPQALELVRVIRTDLDALEPPTPGAEQLLRWGRTGNAFNGAIAAYEIGDFAASESYARSAVEDWQWQPPGGLSHELLGAQFKAQLAQALARQGRYAEAGEILRPLLAYLRAQHAQPHENLMIDFNLAHALYAASRAEPGERDAHLAEATAILDRLPPSMSRWDSGQRLRAWISQARAATG
jgi:tetratricopeptide (TPR) repeat protein